MQKDQYEVLRWWSQSNLGALFIDGLGYIWKDDIRNNPQTAKIVADTVKGEGGENDLQKLSGTMGR